MVQYRLSTATVRLDAALNELNGLPVLIGFSDLNLVVELDVGEHLDMRLFSVPEYHIILLPLRDLFLFIFGRASKRRAQRLSFL